MGKSTIKEVAKMAGVSIGTVSRYINGFSVKEKNKKHIEEAIKKLNFETNYLAQGLRSKKTNSIGVLVPDIGDIFVTQVIEGIETVLNEQNFSTIICSSQNQWNIESEKLDFLNDQVVLQTANRENPTAELFIPSPSTGQFILFHGKSWHGSFIIFPVP